MPVQTPVPIRLPGSFPPNVPQPSGHNSSPLPPPADYYVSRKELLEIAPDLGVMKSVPSAANDTVVLFDDKGQVKSSGVKLSDKADTETVEILVGEDGGKSAREIAKEEVNQLLGEDPNELYDTFTEVSEFIDEAKQNYQAINNALSEEVTRATQSEAQIDGKINTIVADDAGKSARTIAAEEVAKVVADAPADFDTLKEIAAYIESDKTGAAQMVTKIDDNAKAITAEVTRATKAEAALDKTITEKVGAVENGMMAVTTMAESAQQAADTAQQAADTAQQAADTAQQAADTAQQTADTALTTAQMADSSVLDLSARCDDINMVARNAEEHASMANTTASLAMETANAAYSPTNPPPAPDLSGYATKTAMNEVTAAVSQVQVSVDSASNALQSMGEALTVINDKADAALPRYQFTSAGILDGVVTIPPYTHAGMLSGGTAFTVAVGEGNGYMRDCILCVECGDVAPTITWPANFHPRTDAETDFACVAGVNNVHVTNVYWISEYAQGEFAVAGWQATAGGSAV